MSLRLRAKDVPGAMIRFRSLGLPAGLTLNQTSGRISGRIKHAGTYQVILAAVDEHASIASAKLTWKVGGAARIIDPSLTGTGNRQPTLSFTVAVGRGSPDLQDLSVTVPRGLTLGSVRGVSLTSGSGHPRFSAHMAGGSLAIALPKALGRVRITLSYPALRVSGRHPNASPGQTRELTVQVTDASRGSSRVRAHV